MEVTETSISEIKNDQLWIRGRSLDSIVENSNHLELVYALIRGAWPKEHEREQVLQHFQLEIKRQQSTIESLLNQKKGTFVSLNPLDGLLSKLFLLRNECLEPLQLWLILPGLYFGEPLSRDLPINDFLWSQLVKNHETAASQTPSDLERKAMELLLMIHSENEINYSTFTLRMAAHLGSSFLDSMVAAIQILRSPLHGGASEEVMVFLDEVSEVSPRKLVEQYLDQKKRLMGFGHVIFKNGDPRATILKKMAMQLKDLHGSKTQKILKDAEAVEDLMKEKKGLFPNVDYYSAVLYKMLGFENKCATFLFIWSRFAGWMAHYDEQKILKKMIIPRSKFRVL